MNEDVFKHDYIIGVNKVVDESIAVCADMNIDQGSCKLLLNILKEIKTPESFINKRVQCEKNIDIYLDKICNWKNIVGGITIINRAYLELYLRLTELDEAFKTYLTTPEQLFKYESSVDIKKEIEDITKEIMKLNLREEDKINSIVYICNRLVSSSFLVLKDGYDCNELCIDLKHMCKVTKDIQQFINSTEEFEEENHRLDILKEEFLNEYLKMKRILR